MKNLALTFLLILTGCTEETPTDFGRTVLPASGENKSLNLLENTSKEFTYTIEQKESLSSTKIAITKNPEHGSLNNCSVNASTVTCTYVPSKDYVGLDQVGFQAVYGDFQSEEESFLSFNVISDDTVRPLTGDDQSEKTSINNAISFVISSGFDPDGDSAKLQYKIVTQPKNGTLSNCLQDNLNCTYTPNTGFSGSDSFTYQVIDIDGYISEKTAKVSIETINNCVNVKRLAIFSDKNSNAQIDEGEELGEVDSYIGELTSKANYNYYSASAHPIIGPTPSGFYGNVFLYEGSDGLSLNMFFNVDDGGSEDNQVQWDVYTKNNSKLDSVILSDDGSEFKLVNNDDTNYDQKFEGRWHYWTNTDGGVIGPFNGTDFEIRVDMLLKGDINDINFHSSTAEDNVFLISDPEEEKTTFFLKYATSTECREI